MLRSPFRQMAGGKYPASLLWDARTPTAVIKLSASALEFQITQVVANDDHVRSALLQRLLNAGFVEFGLKPGRVMIFSALELPDTQSLRDPSGSLYSLPDAGIDSAIRIVGS